MIFEKKDHYSDLEETLRDEPVKRKVMEAF